MFKYIKYTPITDEYTTHTFTKLNDETILHHFDMPYVSIECKTDLEFTQLMASQNPLILSEEITQEVFWENIKHSDQVQRMTDVSNDYYEQLMLPITLKYRKVERDTWSSQIEESLEFLTSLDETSAPMITILAEGEGITAQEYATNVLLKRTEFNTYSAECLSKKRKILKELKAEIGV